LRDYCIGPDPAGASAKSVEPMAARTAPARTSAQAPVVAEFCRDRVVVPTKEVPGQGEGDGVCRRLERHGSIEGVDHRRHEFFPRREALGPGWDGKYCGQLGQGGELPRSAVVAVDRQSPCQACRVAYQLYLPQDWRRMTRRRRKAGRARNDGLQDQAAGSRSLSFRGACENPGLAAVASS